MWPRVLWIQKQIMQVQRAGTGPSYKGNIGQTKSLQRKVNRVLFTKGVA